MILIPDSTPWGFARKEINSYVRSIFYPSRLTPFFNMKMARKYEYPQAIIKYLRYYNREFWNILLCFFYAPCKTHEQALIYNYFKNALHFTNSLNWSTYTLTCTWNCFKSVFSGSQSKAMVKYVTYNSKLKSSLLKKKFIMTGCLKHLYFWAIWKGTLSAIWSIDACWTSMSFLFKIYNLIVQITIWRDCVEIK